MGTRENMSWKPSSRSGLPLAPLTSPTLASLPGKLKNRVPTQIRRAIPFYLACVLLFVLVSRIQVFAPAQPQAIVLKRHDPQRLRAGPDESDQDQAAGFPKKIWQSWKTDPLNFEQRNFDTARTWTSMNPGYRYEVLTDHNALLYVEDKFGPRGFNRPDIVDLYRAVNATIVKADLLRYMIMYAEGGVYADIDVEALKPADRFIPARYSPADIDMVIGVEIDQPEFRDHPILGQKCMSFCQWTFMCRPRLPVMLQLVENIKTWLSEIASQQQVSISDVALDFDAIISGTGPSAFTAAVLAEMNKDRPGQDEITWSHFHALDESLIVNRILVLDVEKFAAGQGHSNSGNHGSRSALVKHHYHASNWPSKHPRFSHPAHGEVERCNWDAACVRKWDEDVAAYAALGEEEQQRRVVELRGVVDGSGGGDGGGGDAGGNGGGGGGNGPGGVGVGVVDKVEEARKEREKVGALERLAEVIKKQEEEARKRAEEAAREAGGDQGQPVAGFPAQEPQGQLPLVQEPPMPMGFPPPQI